MNLYRVPPLARAVGWIANKIDPSVFERVAITIGGTILYLIPTPAIERHEWMHVVQAARYCPRWLRWLPVRVQAWIGCPWFLPNYRRQQHRPRIRRERVRDRSEVGGMKISTSGGMFLGDFSIAVPKIDPIVCGVTVVHTAKTPNKRDARRAKRKIKK